MWADSEAHDLAEMHPEKVKQLSAVVVLVVAWLAAAGAQTPAPDPVDGIEGGWHLFELSSRVEREQSERLAA